MLIKGQNQKGAMFVTICIFLKKGFTFQPNICNRCHELLMIPINLGDVDSLNIKGSDYRFIINGISKNEVVNLMENTDLTEKSGTL